MAKLQDVAKEAGVSVTLASFVMNGRAEEMRIAPATIQRVQAAARKLSYIPNIAAKRLITSEKTPSVPEICFLWPPKLHPTLLGRYMMLAQSLFRENVVPEMNLIIQTLDAEQETRLSASYFQNHFNGVLISPIKPSDVAFVDKISTMLPVIVLHTRMENRPNIIVDHYAAGELPARIFARHGHKKLMIVSSEAFGGVTEMNRQLIGFTDVCEAENMPFETLGMPNESMLRIARRSAYGKELASELIESGRLPEAIYIRDDVATLGFIGELNIRGVRVPEDIEVMTYGATVLTSACCPSITTVDYPEMEIARASLIMMNDLLRDPFREPETVCIRPTVTYRESCPE